MAVVQVLLTRSRMVMERNLGVVVRARPRFRIANRASGNGRTVTLYRGERFSVTVLSVHVPIVSKLGTTGVVRSH